MCVHGPANRRCDPARLARRPSHDRKVPVDMCVHPSVKNKVMVLVVGEHMTDVAGLLTFQSGESGLSRPGIVHMGGCDQDGQQQPHTVNHEMPLSTNDIFHIIPPPAAHRRTSYSPTGCPRWRWFWANMVSQRHKCLKTGCRVTSRQGRTVLSYVTATIQAHFASMPTPLSCPGCERFLL